MNLTPRKLEELSGIRCEYFTCEFPEGLFGKLLVVVLKGECGLGCGCYKDCMFMTAMVRAGYEGFQPDAVIMDLSELKYEWGDEMTGVLMAAQGYYVEAEFPTTVVVSDKCREGLTSLVRDEMSKDPKQWLFESLPDAIEAAIAKHRNIGKPSA